MLTIPLKVVFLKKEWGLREKQNQNQNPYFCFFSISYNDHWILILIRNLKDG